MGSKSRAAAIVNVNPDSAAALIMLIERKAPEYFDLLTAETDEEFDAAFDAILEQAIVHLETNKRHFAALSEEALTAVLIAKLGIPGLTVTPETHSNGHVDLTITADHCVPARKKLGEAKIYKGPSYHIDGVTQLLERYTTGRETRGLLIAYFKKNDIAGLMGKVRTRMDAERPCGQCSDSTDHPLKWSFVSRHKLSSGDEHNVAHIGCNLHVDEGP